MSDKHHQSLFNKSCFSWQIEAISSNIDLLKRLTLYRRRLIDQWVHYRNYQNSMRMIYKQINKFMENKIQNASRIFEKDMAHNIL